MGGEGDASRLVRNLDMLKNIFGGFMVMSKFAKKKEGGGLCPPPSPTGTDAYDIIWWGK